MPRLQTETINEVDFCAKMAVAFKGIFIKLGATCPFNEVRIEGKGSTTGKNKRKDLRFYDEHNRVRLTGEVKLPGGPLAFDAEVVKDASDKAEDANVQFFFTWDVNTFILWDRHQVDKPLLERRIKVWPLRLNLRDATEVARPETLAHIEAKFLPDLTADLSDIVGGRRRDWSLPPDEIFLRSLESHLDWPISLLRQHLHEQADANKRYDGQLQKWLTDQGRPFLRGQPEEWRTAIENAARTLAYVWTDRFIFYKALRGRFPQLPKLELGPNVKISAQAVNRLEDLFNQATEVSGDYETLLFPQKNDWANNEVFAPDGAVDAWRGFLRGIDAIDFRDVPADVVGLIFQKLVSPEERHRLGQHFTGPDPVDLINSFCIRSANATVLDPACGSGSFLVRAYYRKQALSAKHRGHVKMLAELYGCDIALYPAHLATLNLAAREINDEANYPRIARDSFFNVAPDQPFCELPLGPHAERQPVMLPPLDAVVGNPPYVRQEKVSPADKKLAAARVAAAYSDTAFTGRADLHCYFWPAAARFLKPGGYFGFLTSGQWLDVDYGFALQRWMLRFFRVVAVLESNTERWFPDARVKTCITILQRCDDAKDRDANVVKFVRFEQPLADLIGVPPTGEVGDGAARAERDRQAAVDRLRDELEAIDRPVHDGRWRVLLKSQRDLWDEGVQAGKVLRDAPAVEEEPDDEADDGDGDTDMAGQRQLIAAADANDYTAGKWGRFLRAPDLYFDVMHRFGKRFVSLGTVVKIRRGITSGCDAFFMPRDVTADALGRTETDAAMRKRFGVGRADLEAGAYRIIKDGGGGEFAIESRFVKPEVHSLMKVHRPVVRAADLDRVVLMVGVPLSVISKTFAHRYVKHGATAAYASTKSKAVPIPERATCASRERWYDLTNLVNPRFRILAQGATVSPHHSRQSGANHRQLQPLRSCRP